jgi:hypothetical protein
LQARTHTAILKGYTIPYTILNLIYPFTCVLQGRVVVVAGKIMRRVLRKIAAGEV